MFVSPPLYVEILTPCIGKVTMSWRWNSHVGFSVIIKETPESSPAFFFFFFIWRHKQKSDIYKPGSGPSPNTESAESWSWTSQLLELGNPVNSIFCYSSPKGIRQGAVRWIAVLSKGSEVELTGVNPVHGQGVRTRKSSMAWGSWLDVSGLHRQLHRAAFGQRPEWKGEQKGSGGHSMK